MRSVKVVLGALVAILLAATSASAAPRDVLYVGNNWDGTADVVDPHSFAKLAHVNIVPDLAERMAEIAANPERMAYFLAVRQAVGEGHDQLVDDMFSSPDGRFLYVSRPSLADVVAFDLRTQKIVWRVKVDGNRADHMGISPDGRTLLVSASTAGVVDVIDTAKGEIFNRFESGDQPHESNYSKDGKLIYHASIGTVFTPADLTAADPTKGERVFEIVDAQSFKVLKKLDMGQKLAEFGRDDLSGAVRPMAVAPDEKTVFFQVSFFHGFVEYDLVHDKVVRLANLPISEKAANTPREEYLLDSAHHGLSINPEGNKLCAAGTVSDYATIVDRATFTPGTLVKGSKPYWSTNSGDGKYCFVSFSGDDAVAVISYATGKEVARFGVGDHPQRMRMGTLETGALGVAAAPDGGAAGGPAAKPKLRVSVAPKRVRAKRPVTVRVRVTVRRAGSVVPVAGARVQVGGVRGKTDAEGRVRLRKRFGFDRVGSYSVKATRAGHVAGRATLRAMPRR